MLSELNPALYIVLLGVLLELRATSRRGFRWNVLHIALLGLVGASAVYAIRGPGDEPMWTILPLAYGFIVFPLVESLSVLSAIARVRQSYGAAMAFQLVALLGRPAWVGVLRVRLYWTMMLHGRGRLDGPDALARLRGSFFKHFGGGTPQANAIAVEVLQTFGSLIPHSELGSRLLGDEQSADFGRSAPDDFVRSCLEAGGPVSDSRAFLEGEPVGSPQGNLGRWARLQRARVILMAAEGKEGIVTEALAPRSLLRPLFTPTERGDLAARVRAAEAISGPPAGDDPMVRALETSLRLPTAFSLLLSPPPVAIALFGLCGLAFLGLTWSGSTTSVPHLLWAGGMNGDLVTGGGQWWRLVSSMFLHAGVLHLVFNMVMLMLFANDVERLAGSSGFAALYLVSGLAGGLVAMELESAAVAVGASGAVFGVAGAAISLLISQRHLLPRDWFRRQLASYVIFMVINGYIGASIGFISFWAHAGGFGAGLVVGPVLTRLSGSRLASSLVWGTWVVALSLTSHQVAQTTQQPVWASVPFERVSFTDPEVGAEWSVEVPFYWTDPPDELKSHFRIGGDRLFFGGKVLQCSTGPRGAFGPESDDVAGFRISRRKRPEYRELSAIRGLAGEPTLSLDWIFAHELDALAEALAQRMLATVRVDRCGAP